MKGQCCLLVISFCVLLFARISSSIEQEEDNVGQIILEGEERELSGTDRIAILQAKENHVKYRLISSNEECALKRFVKSRFFVKTSP